MKHIVFYSSLAGQCQPADVVFLIDNTVTGDVSNFQLEIDFAINTTRRLTENNDCVQFGVVLFGTPIQSPLFLNTYGPNAVTATINDIRALGTRNTQRNLAEALTEAIDVQFTPQNGDRPGAPNIAIIITDGTTNPNPGTGPSALQEATRAKTRSQDPINIFTVGVNGNIDRAELQAISSNNQAYVATDFTQLNGLVGTVTQAARQVIATGPSTQTGNDVNVQVSCCKPFMPQVTMHKRSIKVQSLGYTWFGFLDLS